MFSRGSPAEDGVGGWIDGIAAIRFCRGLLAEMSFGDAEETGCSDGDLAGGGRDLNGMRYPEQ